jgi:quercetin dioxygenase-like cupin family protein
VKRVVNGWTENGEPAILYEGEPPSHFDFGAATSDEIWCTDSVPAVYRGTGDPTAGGFRVEPPIGGSICRIATYRPGASYEIHSTQTVDYIIVVSGELTMLLEDREITLTPGDVVVQLAAPHGWANRGSSDCVAVAILLTAEGATEEELIKWP